MRRRLVLLLLVVAAGLGTSLVLARTSSDDASGGPHVPSPVTEWNELALELIARADGQPAPTIVSRQLYLLHAAMFEAWAAFEDGPSVRLADPTLERAVAEFTGDEVDLSMVIDATSAWMLGRLFPEASDRIAEVAKARLAEMPSPGVETPQQVGALVAEQVYRARADDGSYAERRYMAPTDPYALEEPDAAEDGVDDEAIAGVDSWEPLLVPSGSALVDGAPIVDFADPESFVAQVLPTPHWGTVETFAIGPGDRFRPAVGVDPSQYELGTGSGLDEVVAAATVIDDAARDNVAYWTDRAGSISDVGAWNEIARLVSIRDRHELVDDLRLFYALNAALLDTTIATWDAKRVNDQPRPISVVQRAHPDVVVPIVDAATGVASDVSGDRWHPLQDPLAPSPAWPAFPSVRAAVAETSVEVLRQFTGSTEAGFDTTGQRWWDGSEVSIEWSSLDEVSQAARGSVVDGGIALAAAADEGASMGREIGSVVYVEASRHWIG